MAMDDEYAYINPERTRTLLETPSGFALFDVDDDALKEADDTWVYFRDVDTAKNVMFTLGFVKFDDKTTAWDGQTGPSNELIRLIRRYCKGRKHLIVQSADIKVIIEEKLNVKCSYDKNVVDELVWGMKNVLREFILQEKYNVTREYRCLPVSKGLKQCLKDHLINLSTTELDANFIPKIGLLHYLNITLKQVPRMLRESYGDHVCRIGEHIKSNSMYARVLARILVPELAPEYDFCKMLSPDLALKIQEADKSATKYRDEQLTMHDREIIMGALSILLSVPKQRDDIMICVKLMEAEMCTRLMLLEDPHEKFVRVPTNLKHSTFRRTLLETPSGFAIFDVNEDVFRWPRHMWVRFIDAREARQVVLALGFVNVKDNSIAQNSYDGPGQELSSLILNLCGHDTKLIVQDDAHRGKTC
ncbi:probable nucleolar protein 5-1 [Panicum virgatum]|nr:probable nucleolar protein 5-1 [Panicum virgatum]